MDDDNEIQTFKMDEILICATLWIIVDDIMLNERNSYKDHILYDYIYTKCQEQPNPEAKDYQALRPGEEDREVAARQLRSAASF